MGCGKNEGIEDTKRRHDCICEVVRFIKRVQDIGTDDDCIECETDCFMAPLGSMVSPVRNQINTRAFMLLDKQGDAFKTLYKKTLPTGSPTPNPRCGYSVFFRVQNIFDGCCATLQVLEPQRLDGTPVDIYCDGHLNPNLLCEVKKFGKTDTCITVDLDCFCGIQCVMDTFIDFCPDN
ncbi:CotY/CotZ family spore coat protein [Filibacter tadaridae]|uniref:Spore coat protein Y n=1 Tax=Filibacter tadaridae TaxID=2483811 RepID=A0A3P5XB98_9BACL|nr:CotY/CotZ family spore coat protein [Filibacter tadaridae]VDC27485.1 Spore coat protein Y [Filibacter tadaridae]